MRSAARAARRGGDPRSIECAVHTRTAPSSLAPPQLSVSNFIRNVSPQFWEGVGAGWGEVKF